MTEVNFEELAKRWWVEEKFLPTGFQQPTLNKKPKNKKIIQGIYNIAYFYGFNTKGLDVLIKQYSPRKSVNDPEQVAFLENNIKYVNNRFTRTTPGRFIKKLFPDIDDKGAEAFSIFWKDNIAFDPDDYVLHVGNTREDFRNAFVKYCRNVNVEYSSEVKSISDSCMRYTFSGLPCHPAEVYASGDFEVVTIKTKSGKTRARVVVRVKDQDGKPVYVYNVIYGNNIYSVNLIKEYLKSKNGKSLYYNPAAWDKAKLLKIKASSVHNSCQYVIPYIDVARYITWDKDDNIVTYYDYNGDNSYAVGNTTGLANLRKKSCRNLLR